VLLQWVALVSALSSLLGWRDGASRQALALSTSLLLAVSLAAAATLGTSPLAERALLEPGLGIARAALLVAALIALTARHRESPFAWASAVFVAPAAASGAVALLTLLVAPPFTAALVTAAVGALVVMAGAAVALRARIPHVRLASDLGAAIVIAVAAWPTPLPRGRVLFPSRPSGAGRSWRSWLWRSVPHPSPAAGAQPRRGACPSPRLSDACWPGRRSRQ